MQKKLTIPQQIALMKEEGIGFNIINETEAQRYITEDAIYFNIKTFAKNYCKYTRADKAGQYINLEFAYLKELSIIDGIFRKLVLDMCLDIEYSMKVQINRDFTCNPDEDGYSIVEEFFRRNPYVKRKLEKMAEKRSPYTTLVYTNFLQEPALWNLVQVLSFGEFVNFHTLYYHYYPPEYESAAFLQPVKYLRNAAAHNNCLLNNMRGIYTINANKALNQKVASISEIGAESRSKRMKVPVLHDFAALLFVFEDVVNSKGIRRNTVDVLDEFVERCLRHKEYFTKNDFITANFRFAKKLIDNFKKSVII
ncbi:MAG: Abi family protein [Bacillota bacterium]|nr:Abi family protein [Bacillota bacterium]